ncbi:aldehyde ferredoxin oxidoreductase family protein [Sedimentibacter sp.]|uniref:aldehyde ferredoxin oxidoreductase family protein n=1 Tax=Sedimentibacter sp. TaxID=1960295 RepID=UPI0028A8E34C|nr:aldehyde ferredoxin oxidoreductase family protein [Sedimentibacter sp.]
MYNQFPDAKILKVDLTKGEAKIDVISGEIYRLYPGGSSLGLYLALNEMKSGIDPLSPENALVFSVSALTGLPISGISRLNVTAKSPLTGTIGDSQAGGFFPVHLKANGYDAIVFNGKSDKPVYLFIDGDKFELRSAENVWGKVTGEAEDIIRKELNRDDVEIAQIGPGGENVVKYACIINMCNRANGRNGMGAVMGSKNLKAVVVAKGKPIKPYNNEKFMELSKSVAKRLKENGAVAGLGQYGTDGDLEGFSDEGFLVTRNWTSGYFPEGAEKLTGTTMYDTILKERDTCFACAVRCKRVVEVPGLVDPLYGGPEYETVGTFGSYCGVTDLEYVSLANQLCNMYGVDTISCGATIAFAMECYEKGLLNEEICDGIKLNFGNEKALPILIEKIAKREGIGDLLAEGSYRAAEKIGKGAVCLTVTVKKQELPAHMPQFKPAVGLIYAVNPFGADHQSSEHDPFLVMPPDSRERKRLAKIGVHKGYEDNFTMDDDKVRFALDTQKYFSILDTLCLCQFVWGPSWELYGPDEMVELCKYGLGWDTSIYELMQVGERRINMMRYFNSREGFTKDDDQLPEKVFIPLKGGPTDGVVLDKEAHEKAKELYYELAGWHSENGNPTVSTMRKLSLQWLIN